MTELLPMNTSHLPVKLTLDDYLLLDGSGAFANYQKTELIDGEIFFMNAQHRPHVRLKMALYEAIKAALPAGSPLTLFIEASVALSGKDAPEPDLLLTSEPDGDGLIPGASVALIVEVSDTTLRKDLGEKQEAYARAGIPEYWVANLEGRLIRQMWSPANDGYGENREITFGAPLSAATIPNLTIVTDNL
ncbi:Uma2 family endonuclease [Sphingomonas jeddahensis]|uniref:Putative restriction endonuclease domain-containing protein n=1 Tax=Sphingomonas jeddahensis TaxID=1915074 RepID=A0A1V2EU34_9SPHN|nr:Uma2 family endonuclease [Sphingomonas jeddahensis]ONF95995.1 hypothetical protein SPHI_19240 [Sphingomonas jeddahensis]